MTPTREQPVSVDGLTIFPEDFLISGTPYPYECIREICWKRKYTQVTGMTLGSEEEILFSFRTTGSAAFSKSYQAMFFTEARRKIPNAMWSAFCSVAEKSYASRIASYADQIQKTKKESGVAFQQNGLDETDSSPKHEPYQYRCGINVPVPSITFTLIPARKGVIIHSKVLVETGPRSRRPIRVSGHATLAWVRQCR